MPRVHISNQCFPLESEVEAFTNTQKQTCVCGGGSRVAYLAPNIFHAGPGVLCEGGPVAWKKGDKISVLPKLICELITIPSKLPQEFFVEPGTLI